MQLIALSVFCSVMVSVLLKLTPRIDWDIRQIIAGGYLVAATLCWFTLSPAPTSLFTSASFSAWGILLALGVLLPSLFLVLAYSVNHVGIVLTDAAQRLSLLLPLFASFVFFGEAFDYLKGTGMALGLLAIILIISRRADTSQQGTRKKLNGWHWPLIVFIGMGFIDILFKQMAQLAHLPFADVLFATFIMAFALSAAYVAYIYSRHQAFFSWRNLAGALALGSFNFGNILFYIKAHQALASNPVLVFSAMNIGVIVLGALVGLWLFKERLSRLNKAGIALAVLAVMVLTYARQ